MNTTDELTSSMGELQQWQRSLKSRLRAEWQRCVPAVLFERAFAEAVLLASSTGYPQLFLPELAKEQVGRLACFCDETPTSLAA